MGRKKLAEDQRRTNKDWYEDHKEEYNDGRKKKYADDPEYRDKQLNAAKDRYRKDHGILSDGGVILISEGEQFVCYRLSKVADDLGVDRQKLRRYLYQFFPIMKFDGAKMNFITVDQIPLVEDFIQQAEQAGSHKGAVKKVAESMSEMLESNWRNRNGSRQIIDQEGQG